MSSPHVKTSEKHGAWTWIKERASAVALIPLTLWGVVMAVAIAGMSHGEALAYTAQPVNAAVVALGLLVAIYHMHLGLRVVVEDYLRGPTEKLVLTLNALFCIGLALAGLVLVILIALGSAPAGA